jgi:hypothetical protein
MRLTPRTSGRRSSAGFKQRVAEGVDNSPYVGFRGAMRANAIDIRHRLSLRVCVGLDVKHLEHGWWRESFRLQPQVPHFGQSMYPHNSTVYRDIDPTTYGWGTVHLKQWDVDAWVQGPQKTEASIVGNRRGRGKLSSGGCFPILQSPPRPWLSWTSRQPLQRLLRGKAAMGRS